MPTKKTKKPADSDPCWKGYEQVGLKKKNGKEMPNCVPEKKNPGEKGK